MTTVKLEHDEVMKQLEDMIKALNDLKLETFNKEELGENEMAFTKMWLEKEEYVQKTAAEYVTAVLKNIEDTKDNVNYLREQDEAITTK
ncbi:hypothetical protein GKZ89_16480 [Bacillus mangrovi]|uniref:YwqI/YxiC family protein n=1 Tax=Metabacillus mangrovi TaxID=1491830 RepID=A0A7X2S885_9BACI|nr:DUF5344 family protein [Metabacillus mangrovi]MTH55001.1 hypothetical protein [Metabacillus mangrovi]